ncbi:MAG: hypothetical protein ABW292_23510 [Vicinamibacterales bacterium]
MRLASVSGMVVAVFLACDAVAVGQGLGDVAKREAERRKAVGTPGKVYTNDNLRTDAPPPSAPATTPQGATPPAAPAQAPAAAAGAGVQTPGPQPTGTAASSEPGSTTEDAWRKRITVARDALSRAQVFAEALQSRINALTTDFVNRDDPAQRNAIAGERQKALAEIDRVKQEIVDHQKAISAIQDEARRAGVPAGWVR